MRFFIPFTLILAAIALATALNADNMVDENQLTVEEAARCLRGYQNRATAIMVDKDATTRATPITAFESLIRWHGLVCYLPLTSRGGVEWNTAGIFGIGTFVR
ncbi:hypothetical protein ETB97_011191 [Aspergillus alliaceus]|uniref:Uncharacterized protein n=1 Tax=Petromyces alliaceus TaxID=209559 RepID=A0A8H6E7Y0_PETAA|nr:hypothetical protein ETB97_011191 [Aspergillus burnettii]